MKPLIVACTDFSPCSDAALREAARIAERDGARVFLIHVYNPKSIGHRQSEEAIEDGSAWDEATMTSLRSARRKFFPEMIDTDVQYDAVPDAHPATAIGRVANDLNAELIVIGSHGRTGLARTLLGSVAEQTVRHAPCNVLVVRSG